MARDQHCKIDRQPRVSLKFGEGERENTQKTHLTLVIYLHCHTPTSVNHRYFSRWHVRFSC